MGETNPNERHVGSVPGIINPGVSVVCLSFRRPHLLRRALHSVMQQTQVPDEIIVVDNASPESAEISAVVNEFPGIRFIANPANLGFAGGMNVGLAAARHEWILITEDDLVLQPDCLHQFVEAEGAADLLGGVLIDNNTGRIESAGGNLRLRSGYWGQVVLLERFREAPVGDQPIPRTFVQGCLLFAQARQFHLHGGFREDYFVYDEDVELCARWHARGLRIALIPTARALHLAPHAGGLSEFTAYHHEKNLLATFYLYAPAWKLPEVFLRFVAVRFALTIARRDWKGTQRLWRACRWLFPRLLNYWSQRNGRWAWPLPDPPKARGAG